MCPLVRALLFLQNLGFFINSQQCVYPFATGFPWLFLANALRHLAAFKTLFWNDAGFRKITEVAKVADAFSRWLLFRWFPRPLNFRSLLVTCRSARAPRTPRQLTGSGSGPIHQTTSCPQPLLASCKTTGLI
jgi:hypothetical protein